MLQNVRNDWYVCARKLQNIPPTSTNTRWLPKGKHVFCAILMGRVRYFSMCLGAGPCKKQVGKNWALKHFLIRCFIVVMKSEQFYTQSHAWELNSVTSKIQNIAIHSKENFGIWRNVPILCRKVNKQKKEPNKNCL